MAKVDGPLFSLEARGKIGDAVVYFPWKGRHVVRQWLKPTQPNSIKQGYVRAAMKAIGKAIKEILTTAKGDAVDSALYAYYTDIAPAGQNWNGHLAKGFCDLLQAGNVLVTGSFTDLVDAFSSLSADPGSSFADAATALGMVDFAFGYGYTDNIPAGMQLYFAALAAYNQSVHDSAPYDTDPDSWATADVGLFQADFETA